MSCCVPECPKKVYRDENGAKILFFKFPRGNLEKKRWHFRVTEFTKICSRHFRTGDLRKTLGGKCEVKNGVVPSVFPWIRTSPRKRKEPTARNFNALRSGARNLNTPVVSAEEPAQELPVSVSDLELNSGSTTQDSETQTELTDHEVYLANIISNNDKKIQEMEQEIKELKRQLQYMQRQNDDLNDRLFMLEIKGFVCYFLFWFSQLGNFYGCLHIS